MGSDVRLHVLGASLSSLSFLKEPWQLSVRTAKSVHGLPPSQTTMGAYLLQNAAARAAGWTASRVSGGCIAMNKAHWKESRQECYLCLCVPTTVHVLWYIG